MRKRITISTLLAMIIFCSAFWTHAENATLRAGVASMITPVSAVRYYQQVVDYIGKRLNTPIEMVHRTTYDEIDVMLENGELEVAFICSSPYVLDNEKFGAELLVAPMVKGEVFYHSNIIVHKDSEIERFEDLQGKTFGFVDPKSNSGKLYPTYLLARNDNRAESFFENFSFSYSHNKSVELVAKKRIDGAAVDSIVYDFMVATDSPYTKQTRIIHRSPRFGIPPVVVPPGLPIYLKQSLKQIFLEMHNDPEGSAILEQMRIEKFVEVEDENYDSIRAMRAFLTNNIGNEFPISPGEKSGQQSESNHVLFGVLPRDNPILAYERYQPLMDYLSQVTGLSLELHLEKSYTDVVNSVGRGRISFALLGPLSYLDANKKFEAVPIARSRTANGKAEYRTVIVTSEHSGISKITELNNRRFAFAALWSTSGNLVPRYMLAWSGIHLENLASYHHFNYHDTVAKKVISGEFDAGALRKSTADRYQDYGLKILTISDPIPTGPVVASPHTGPEILQKIREALLDMGNQEEGRKVLTKLDPDLQGGFVSASDADYFEIRNMINGVPNSCGIKCHPKTSF